MEYTQLGRSGLKVSKVILGCMQYGTSTQMEWTTPEEKALPVIKHAFDKGINTWDTADLYSLGDSERIVGKALKHYNIRRDRVVILSKCYAGVLDHEEMEHMPFHEQLTAQSVNDGPLMVNRVGLSRKHVFDAVDASVERLGTYIDVLQIHRLDRNTPREEIMKALNDVIEAGKVRYIGASSMYAWEFQALNNIAEKHGWHKFISMQDHHSLLHREEEREMFPYCHDAGIGLIPWSPLARGWLTRPYDVSKNQPTDRQKTDTYSDLLIGPITEEDVEIIKRVEELAKKKNATMAQICIAWSLKKGTSPILGLSSIERVDEAASAVARARDGLLADEDVRYLEDPYIPKTPVSQVW